MAFWLFKQEPTDYSFADLERDGKTTWDGVTNALALKHLRTIKPGDKVFFYETGEVKAVMGIMEIAAGPIVDLANDKLVSCVVSFFSRIKHPVTLATIKADDRFAQWELVRISRLSVMPVTKEIWKAIELLGKKSN